MYPLFLILEVVWGEDPKRSLEFLLWLLKVLSGWEFTTLILTSLCQ